MRFVSWIPKQTPSITATATDYLANVACASQDHLFAAEVANRKSTTDFLKTIDIWKGRFFAAETDNRRLRDAIQDLHRVWSAGPDIDKDAVATACISVFRVALESSALLSKD